MPSDHDIAVVRETLRRYLTRHGTATAKELCAELGVSQPTFSRYAKIVGNELLALGRSRSRRYAWRRDIAGVPSPIPVFSIAAPGQETTKIADLFPIQPDGFWVQRYDGESSGPYDDLPYFLHDLRPAGFLGRLIPRQHPELGFPPDVRLWSADHTLRYLTTFGYNHVGALIVGEAALQQYLRFAIEPPDAILRAERSFAYPQAATGTLALGPAGSSAAGEQPKFLATRRDDAGCVPVLVKFSPPRDNAANRRVADLLIAEHLALLTLRELGYPAARTELLESDDRVFLEVERFDRIGPQHRRGTISLEALDAEFVGSVLPDWTSMVRALAADGVVPQHAVLATSRLQYFGELIANSDMHRGNLSFTTDGTTVTGLAPAYDMTPMAYAPRAGELVPVPFSPPAPGPQHSPFAEDVLKAAARFWERVSEHPGVATAFQDTARDHAARVRKLLPIAALLPRSPN